MELRPQVRSQMEFGNEEKLRQRSCFAATSFVSAKSDSFPFGDENQRCKLPPRFLFNHRQTSTLTGSSTETA